MPSMHAGWALWCAVAVVTLVRRPVVKVIAALYPVITVAVIFGTANHYVLDAAAGITLTVWGCSRAPTCTGGTAGRQPEDHKVTNKTSIVGGQARPICHH